MKKRIVIFIVFVCFLYSCNHEENIKEQSFVILTDLHLGLGENSDNLQKSLSVIDSLAPDYIFILGDMINGLTADQERTEEQWAIFMDKIGNRSNVKVIPGNHDYWDEKSRSLYKQVNKEFFFSQSVGNFLFIGLDVVDDKYEGQITWLENTLEKNKNKKIVFLTHYPLFEPENLSSPVKINETFKKELFSLINKYNVEYVFSGHLHSFHKITSSFLSQIICGSASFDFQSEKELIKRHFIFGKTGEDLQLSMYQDEKVVSLETLSTEKLKVSNLFTDWNIYNNEEFGISYGLPGEITEGHLLVNNERYEQMFNLSDKLSSLCVIIQEYDKSAKEGIEEDLVQMRKLYKERFQLDIIETASGPFDCKWEGYKWEGYLSDKSLIRMMYVSHNSKIYCILLFTSEENKKENEKICGIFWDTLELN